jgi:putative cell wall-binding protein
MTPGEEDKVNLSRETALILTNAGIPVSIESGYESYVPKTRIVLFEAAIAMASGLPYDEAIKTITIEQQQPFIEKADSMLTLNKELQEQSQKFQRTIQRKFELEELPKKLQDWHKLPYAEFIKELAKKKVKLSLSQEAEWEDYFMQESKKALELKATIDTTDKAIDNMVYELYGLTAEEIEIVEKC